MKVSFHPEVKADLRGSYLHYRGIDPDLGRDFIAEYRKALAFVEKEPLVMRKFHESDWRVFFNRFKSYALVYEVLDSEILVKAVADLRRKPFFWSER